MMTFDRARDIVAAINARCFVTMEIATNLPDLDGVSLAEMVEATAMVRNANAAAVAKAKLAGGGYKIRMVPDDRLIAAVYAIDHFPISNEPILALPADEHHLRALAVVRIKAEMSEAAE